jgi:glycosyltransferase involved in cell wall biosynthesis
MGKRCVFVFRSGRRERLSAAGPREFLYGYAELAANSDDCGILDENDLGLAKPWPALFEAMANRISGLLGVHPRTMWRLALARSRFEGCAIVVSTNHSIGFAVAILKRLRLVKADAVLLTMGLLDRDPTWLQTAWLRWLLGDTKLAVLSKSEAAHLRRHFGGRLDIVDFTFGVDLEFWTPLLEELPSEEVLSVGNDPNRDFESLIRAWQPEFPILTIVTSLSVACEKPNVRIERGDWRRQTISDTDLRDRLQRARFVVVPLRDTWQPSGQSAALQAMACARPVILTANRGLWDRDQIERHAAAKLVAPGDVGELAQAVREIVADPQAATAMGARARRMLEVEDVSSAAMARQIRTLANLPA